MKTVVSAANTTSNVVATPTSTTAANVLLKTEPISGNDTNVTFSAPQGVAPNSSTASNNNSSSDNAAKRPASLDLNKIAKKPRLLAASPLIIDSPDLQTIKALNTPDLEKILLNSNLLQTPQPGLVFPTKVGPVTSEQEAFGKGFEEALHSLHNKQNLQINNTNNNNNNSGNNNSNNNNNNNNTVTTVVTTATTTNVAITSTTAGTGMSGGSFTYTNLGDNSLPVSIKDEPQNGPASPPVSPIDMETQEKIKLERKRQRNRVAASKCRKRKLERISKLEDKVKCLKGENTDLGLVVKTLKDHVAQLKQQVIEHIQSGCSIPSVQYNGTTSSK